MEERREHSGYEFGKREWKRGRDSHNAIRYTVTIGDSSRSYDTMKEAVRCSGYTKFQIYQSLKFGDILDVDYVWTKERLHPKEKR